MPKYIVSTPNRKRRVVKTYRRNVFLEGKVVRVWFARVRNLVSAGFANERTAYKAMLKLLRDKS